MFILRNALLYLDNFAIYRFTSVLSVRFKSISPFSVFLYSRCILKANVRRETGRPTENWIDNHIYSKN